MTAGTGARSPSMAGPWPAGRSPPAPHAARAPGQPSPRSAPAPGERCSRPKCPQKETTLLRATWGSVGGGPRSEHAFCMKAEGQPASVPLICPSALQTTSLRIIRLASRTQLLPQAQTALAGVQEQPGAAPRRHEPRPHAAWAEPADSPQKRLSSKGK